MADKQQELAEERTRLAQRRTVLAEERNYSAWIRTGLASVAAGFAVVKLMSEGEPEWLVRSIGVAFAIAGAAMFIMGYARYRRQVRSTEFRSHPGIPPWSVAAVTVLLVLGGLAALALILLPSDNG